jgi:lipopolysaccharide/colanic/teichoic acid biosynthesis glycosyltransferase
MDIVVAAGGLILLSPFIFLVSVIIKSVSRGPVFFKQNRVGYMGKPFTMWKFRTMKVNCDSSNHKEYITKLINGSAENGAAFGKPMTKLDDDPRIIPFGKILRKTCLDELPQLINVLRGQMSLVGPRPAIDYEVQVYSAWHYRRLDTVPGVTGLWQVNGKNRLTFNQMVRLDIKYLRERSFCLDVSILLKTPSAVLSQVRDSLQEKQSVTELIVKNA